MWYREGFLCTAGFDFRVQLKKDRKTQKSAKSEVKEKQRRNHCSKCFVVFSSSVFNELTKKYSLIVGTVKEKYKKNVRFVEKLILIANAQV